MSALFEQPTDAASAETLEAALASYTGKPPIVVEARSPLMPTGAVTDEDTTEEATTETQEEIESPLDGSGSESEEQVAPEPTAFASQFKDTFGIEPTEAVELVNSLQGFRDEMQLMRTWGVTPAEYDNRITQVREMYNTLPDEGKQEFNSAEGAAAIWDYIQKQNGTSTTKSKAAKSTASVNKTQQKPKAQVYKRSYFNSLPPNEYQRQLPLMQKAFLDGRIIEDIG